jgi:uncharacterized protein (TIGR02996 family)
MNDETFIRAIRAAPEDDAPRLIYADWLEEQGNVRGEYLRLEVQLAQIPARLAQLRGQIDATWLTAVAKRRKVVLASFPPRWKIEVIRVVRQLTGLGLKEAKDLVESPRGTIKDNLSIAEARDIAAQFAGIAVVDIEPAI